ncbi:hypothetical protein Golomagni_05692 [Golovinomyces magnicellulatus]|nr:hypothetical protein Golomagni_05692 [Golovinomyces magnicellulatus]
MTNQILLSECATLRYLETIDIPTPKLYDYGLRGDSDNNVGLAFMLIDKMPGNPYGSIIATPDQKAQVLSEWASILHKLSTHPFPHIGSLQLQKDDAIAVGAIASDRTGTLPCIGPFVSALDYYSSWAIEYANLIADGQIFTQFPADAYLMFKYMAQQSKSGSWFQHWQELNSGQFFLKHMDDKGDHIMVDKNHHIVGIIDWTFARVVPAYEAFGPSLVSADNNDLFSGRHGISSEDAILGKAMLDLGCKYADFTKDPLRRFMFGLGMGLGMSKEEAICLFTALISTFEDTTMDWEEWRHQRLQDWQDDGILLSLLTKGQSTPNKTMHSSSSRFATCTNDQCQRPSVRGRSCQDCRKHLCALHILPKYHKCGLNSPVDDETWEANINQEVERLLKQVNIDELLKIASSLREGIPCQFAPGKHLGDGAIMGCANHHSWITFEDGVRWIVRIPRTSNFSDIPLDLVDYLVESEYATLKFLETTKVPSPKVFGCGLAEDPANTVGVGYILEEAMSGTPFYTHEATKEQKQHVYQQYAEILTEISRHKQPQACSLQIHNDKPVPGPIASNRFLSLGLYGPFADAHTYFASIANFHMDVIADGQLYPKYPKEAFVFYKLLKDKAAPALAQSSESMRGFYLKHVDDKGDHILVDKALNITGIIDWQFARFVPACEAFGPSLFSADLNSLYGNSTTLSADDKLLRDCFERNGHAQLASFAGGSELARRFNLGLASGLMRDEVLNMIKAVLSLLDSPTTDVEAWIEAAWNEAANDARHSKVAQLVAMLKTESEST